MTDNIQELDEILQNVRDDAVATQKGWQGSPYEAKQAITSLIKELVAEAKPERKSTEDYGSWEDGHRNAGWNKCLDQLEQNLLKALEEV